MSDFDVPQVIWGTCDGNRLIVQITFPELIRERQERKMQESLLFEDGPDGIIWRILGDAFQATTTIASGREEDEQRLTQIVQKIAEGRFQTVQGRFERFVLLPENSAA